MLSVDAGASVLRRTREKDTSMAGSAGMVMMMAQGHQTVFLTWNLRSMQQKIRWSGQEAVTSTTVVHCEVRGMNLEV